MNFQNPYAQTDLTASLISASILNQTQNLLPVTNTIESLLKQQQLQLLQNQVNQLLHRSVPPQQIEMPLTFIKNGPFMANPLEMMTSLPSNPLLDAYQISQLSRPKLPLPINSFGTPIQEPNLSFQDPAQALSNLLEKYTTLDKQNETPVLTQTTPSIKKPEEQAQVYQPRPYDSLSKITKKRPRRKAGEIERTHKCPMIGCEKSYGSEASMLQHFRLKHPMDENNQNALSSSVGRTQAAITNANPNEIFPSNKPSQAESTETAISTPRP